jgi:hypothetical protein
MADRIRNHIRSGDIINGEVKNADLGADSVASGKIADQQVKNADLSIGASSSNTIADGGIQAIDVKNNTLTGTQVGEDRRRISSVDADGVALAAIKGLHRELRAAQRLRHEQERRLAGLEARLAALERGR